MLIESVLCQQAWEMLLKDDQSVLIDVRSQAEWQIVGKPQLTHPKQLVLNSLKLSPLMVMNENFTDILLNAVKDKTRKFFLCRYGVRSYTATQIAIRNGLSECYNLSDGFEGNATGPGWLGTNLPIELAAGF